MLGPRTQVGCCHNCGAPFVIEPAPPIGRDATPATGPLPFNFDDRLNLTDAGDFLCAVIDQHLAEGITFEHIWDRLDPVNLTTWPANADTQPHEHPQSDPA